MLFSINQIAQMCGGELSANSTLNLQINLNNVVIDSREVNNQSLFVAIVGEVNDGHKFIIESFNQGVLCAIVNKNSGVNLPNLIYVEDTTKALGLLAREYRNNFNLPVIAITGSNGKTTTKEMLKHICEIEYGSMHVLASESSFNNHWGMPLTLLKLNSSHKVAILEMGMNHHGELNYLSNLAKPTIAVVNNVLLSHVGYFKNLEDIAHAKGEVYNGLIQNGIALINTQIPFYKIWEAQLIDKGCNIVKYGDIHGQCYLLSSNNGNIKIHTPKGVVNATLQILGEHNCYNAVTVVAIAITLGCSIKSIEAGLSGFTAYRHRMEQKIAFNQAVIIDDSYNANPDSVKAAIFAVKQLDKPIWVILGDLKELGDLEINEHLKMGDFFQQQGVAKLITIGNLTSITHKRFIELNKNNALHFNTQEDIVDYCKTNLPTNAVLLVKASNSMQLWNIVDKLTI